ncbi:MAG: ShlB/FhaC/HecB family hemolysin secretion/activation protein, partial [Pseudomonadota bacterium]
MGKGHKISRISLMFAGAFWLVGAAFSQIVDQNTNVAPEVLDPILELERELEERQRQEEREQFRPPALQGEDINPDALPEVSIGPCLHVLDVEVDGVTLLDQSIIDQQIDGIVPGCLDQSRISILMQRLNKVYADRGYITTRVYIPEQDVAATSTLRLVALEGVIEEIELVDVKRDEPISGVRRRLLLGTAYPHKTPRLFQLRDLEQAIDQLSRPSSVNAVLRLEPGEQPGGSRIVIQRRVQDRLRLFAEVNNTGAVSTGQRQARISFAGDSILRANDTWFVTYQGGNNSNALSVSSSLPYGYNTFTAFASYSDFFIPLTDFSELFGRTVSYGTGWSRLLRRSATKRRILSLNLQGRQSARFVNAVELVPQDLATVDIRLSNIVDTDKARWSWDLGPVAGLPVFNDPEITEETGPDIPQNNFVALRGGFTRIGKGRDGLFRWTSSVRFQAASRALFGSEQIAFG